MPFRVPAHPGYRRCKEVLRLTVPEEPIEAWFTFRELISQYRGTLNCSKLHRLPASAPAFCPPCFRSSKDRHNKAPPAPTEPALRPTTSATAANNDLPGGH